jgi:DNA-binding NarL/FixJ family response regulator
VPKSLRSILNDLVQAFTDDVLDVIGDMTPVEIAGETALMPKKQAFTLPLLVKRTTKAWAAEYGLSKGLVDVLERAALGETRDAIAADRGSSRQTVRSQASTLLRRTGDKSLDLAVGRLLRDVVRSKIG